MKIFLQDVWPVIEQWGRFSEDSFPDELVLEVDENIRLSGRKVVLLVHRSGEVTYRTETAGLEALGLLEKEH